MSGVSDPDDVERLVAEIESVVHADPASLLRLARIVRELLALHPVRRCDCASPVGTVWRNPHVCYFGDNQCGRGQDEPCRCPSCRDRALRERLNKIARGEEA